MLRGGIAPPRRSAPLTRPTNSRARCRPLALPQRAAISSGLRSQPDRPVSGKGRRRACGQLTHPAAQHALRNVEVTRCLRHRHTPVRQQSYGLDLELSAEPPSRHSHSPVPWSRSYRRVHETGSRPRCRGRCKRRWLASSSPFRKWLFSKMRFLRIWHRHQGHRKIVPASALERMTAAPMGRRLSLLHSALQGTCR
jgi:hypothetical protein